MQADSAPNRVCLVTQALSCRYEVGEERFFTGLFYGEPKKVNSSGWCRGPTATKHTVMKRKGSLVVVDAINGGQAV